MFNSGTSALHACLLGCGIKQGDNVIVPSFSFIATANSPLFVGAIPIFGDIEERTFGLDPADVERKITKNTKAIMEKGAIFTYQKPGKRLMRFSKTWSAG